MAGLSTSTRRDVPKIGGSATGFIILIVCLVVIILASSFAILHLIREDGSQSVFRSAHHRHRRYEQPSTSGSPFIYDASSNRRLWPWRRLFKHFHSRSNVTDSSAHGLPSTIPVRGGRGCYQIGSSDSWDHTTAQTTEHSHPHEAYPDDASPANSPALSDTNPYGHRTFIHNRDSSASSMHLDAIDLRKPMSLSSPTLSPSNHLASNLEIHRTLSPLPPSSPTPMLVGSPRSGSSMSRRAISPLPEPAVPPGIGRTFEGGSKFLEAL